MRTICLICMLCLAVVVKAASPIQGLLERIDKGASRKFVIEQVKSPTDFFELDQKGDKVSVNMLLAGKFFQDGRVATVPSELMEDAKKIGAEDFVQ